MKKRAVGREEEEHLSDVDASKGFAKSFLQQKLRAWQPVLTPRWIIGVFVAFGLVFLGLGVLMIITSRGVKECAVRYSDPTCANGEAHCEELQTIDFTHAECDGPDGDLKPPIYMYYELTNYHQNHRRYVKSRSDKQLRGDILTAKADLDECDPMIYDDDGIVLSPCGLIAWSVFNDTFRLFFITRTQRHPRILGDVRYLNWGAQKK
eukprot:Polyplicarium_translucidae@DN2013_c0_g1_i3.p1